jgi:hypothetical protein
MLAPMHQEIDVFMSKLEAACDAKEEVNIHSMFSRLTLDIIGTTAPPCPTNLPYHSTPRTGRIAFGTQLNAQTGDDNELIKVSL